MSSFALFNRLAHAFNTREKPVGDATAAAAGHANTSISTAAVVSGASVDDDWQLVDTRAAVIPEASPVLVVPQSSSTTPKQHHDTLAPLHERALDAMNHMFGVEFELETDAASSQEAPTPQKM